MKKIFLVWICLALFAGTSVAQYSRAGNWVDDMRTNAPELYGSYRSGSTLKGVGMGLTFGGLAAAVIGVAAADKETTSTSTGTQVNLSGSGAAVFAVGTVCILVGTPIWIVGGSKKRRARNTYLREYGYEIPAQPAPYLKLNSTANGVGLAMVF
jgi:ABC-type uncharacterized transport system permease subunit